MQMGQVLTIWQLAVCRAAAHSEVNKFAEAIADCENAIRIDPKYGKAYSRLGWVYHAQGRFQEAIEKGFQKALDLDPNNTTAKENLMAAQQKLAEQRRGQSHQQQEPEQQSQNPFGQVCGVQ
jgi:small glutamine-rich tetratricopeptide repeat-containing protein alpha